MILNINYNNTFDSLRFNLKIIFYYLEVFDINFLILILSKIFLSISLLTLSSTFSTCLLHSFECQQYYSYSQVIFLFYFYFILFCNAWFLLLYNFFWIYIEFFRIIFFVNYHFKKMNKLNHSKNKSNIILYNSYEIILYGLCLSIK